MSLTKQNLSDIRDVVLDALDVAVNPRLDRLESGMDKLTGRMDGLAGRMDSQEGKMDRLENNITALEAGQYETSRRLSVVETKLVDVEGSVMALHNDVVELYGMVR